MYSEIAKFNSLYSNIIVITVLVERMKAHRATELESPGILSETNLAFVVAMKTVFQ